MINRVGIWAEMGLGKTVAVLTALDFLWFVGEIKGPVLVIAPKRVAQSVWVEEAAKWEHLSDIVVQPILGNAKQRLAALKNRKANVFTINYDNIPWLIDTLGDRWPFEVIVADESTKLKSYRARQGGKRARALAGPAWSGKVKRFIELTGTPNPNGYKDVWGQVYFLDAGQRLSRSYQAYKDRYFIEDREHFRLDLRPGSEKEIQHLLKDICISFRAKDYFDLADPINMPIYVELPDKARKQYKELETQMFTELQNVFKHRSDGKKSIGSYEVEAVNAAAKTMKCLQLANGAAYVEGSNQAWVEVHDLKLQALEEIVEEAAGMPVLVAYHFKSDLARLQKYFKQARVLDNNPKTIKQWNKGKIPILLAHPASAGHGLNLQDGGNILVFFSHDWNLENFMQIIERIGPVRQMQAGHDRPVFLYHIIARGTADELVIARRKGKRTVQEILMQAMKYKQYEDIL